MPDVTAVTEYDTAMDGNAEILRPLTVETVYEDGETDAVMIHVGRVTWISVGDAQVCLSVDEDGLLHVDGHVCGRRPDDLQGKFVLTL